MATFARLLLFFMVDDRTCFTTCVQVLQGKVRTYKEKEGEEGKVHITDL